MGSVCPIIIIAIIITPQPQFDIPMVVVRHFVRRGEARLLRIIGDGPLRKHYSGLSVKASRFVLQHRRPFYE